MSGLISCKTCSGQLAALADACPACGAPNDWVHEDIRRFISEGPKIATTKSFNYSNTKTTLTGQTASRSPVWAWALGAVVFLAAMVGFFMWGIWATLLLGALAGLVIKLPARPDYFQADLQARTWTSSNERFWRPVRQLLKL
jgi:hypothetical protein